LKELYEAINQIASEAKVLDNPSPLVLREKAKRYSVTNDLGLLLFHTKVTARSPEATVDNVNNLDYSEKIRLIDEMKKVKEYVKSKSLYRVDRNIGTNSRTSLKATALVSSDFPHLALMFLYELLPCTGR